MTQQLEEQPNHLDIMVVGAGMVGSTLALSLADSGLAIGLMDAGPLEVKPFDPQAPFAARVSALSPASRLIFERLGVWDGIIGRRACGYRAMRVWDGLGSGEIYFDSKGQATEFLGHIVENRVVQDAVIERLQGTAVQLLGGSRLVALQRRDGLWQLDLDDGRQYFTSLLIGADGAQSSVKRLTNTPSREWDYLHHAIVTTVHCAEPHQNTAWQRFTEYGPLAFLPLPEPGGRACSIVWSQLPERAAELAKLLDEPFCQALGRAFEERLGPITAADPRVLIPLRQRHARRYVDEGLAFVGDAAHVIHPLAGQGVNLGLLDVAVLSEVLLHAYSRQESISSVHTLSRFERRRMPHNLAMMGAMEGLERLFHADALPMRWLRNAGLGWVDRLPQVKGFFMRQAFGLGELPARWRQLLHSA